MNEATPPLNVAQLNDRLAQLANEPSIPVARARAMLCTLLVSQMLPVAAEIKGGRGVKLRLVESGTRATTDLDASTGARGEEFELAFRQLPAEGWGTVPPYVMRQCRVSIAFLGTPGSGLEVEVSDPGIETHRHPRKEIAGDLLQFWAFFGLGELRPVELVDLGYQIAQKIHAGPDFPRLRAPCVRTFGWRNQQTWPPLPLRATDG